MAPYLFLSAGARDNIVDNNLKYKNLKILENTDVVNIESTDPVQIDIRNNRNDSPIYVYLIGCDGANSFVRKYIKANWLTLDLIKIGLLLMLIQQSK